MENQQCKTWRITSTDDPPLTLTLSPEYGGEGTVRAAFNFSVSSRPQRLLECFELLLHPLFPFRFRELPLQLHIVSRGAIQPSISFAERFFAMDFRFQPVELREC